MISAIDHVVLVVRDIATTLAFYRDVLGLEVLGEDEWKRGERPFPSLKVGPTNMLNVHQAGQPVSPEAVNPQPGSEDLCFVWDGPIEGAVTRLTSKNVPIEIPRQAAGGAGRHGRLRVLPRSRWESPRAHELQVTRRAG